MRTQLLRLGIAFSLVLATGLIGCGTEQTMSPGQDVTSIDSVDPGGSEHSASSSEVAGATPGAVSSAFGLRLPVLDPVVDVVGGTTIGVSGEGLDVLLTKTVSARRGGVVQVGRYKLTFPPNALAEDTEITIAQGLSNDLSTTFELLPHGIQFQEPVTLEVWLGDKLLSPADDVRQYWWDDSSDTYVDMGGTWSYPTMSTPIEHFSKWKSGRAGW
ncbi:MAG: hypothetical protein H6682_12385 [Candidatus Eisenbacteria bacterium]|nr:hypothetical protein [Candidatus Eisenbacteria bacterium]